MTQEQKNKKKDHKNNIFPYAIGKIVVLVVLFCLWSFLFLQSFLSL